MDIKIGNIYKSVINNRLFKIIDIFIEHNIEKVKIECLDYKKGENQYIICNLDYFKRLQIIKVEYGK